MFCEHLQMKKKIKNSVLGHSLAINAKNCLYLYCLFSQAGEPSQFWADCESGKHPIKMATIRHWSISLAISVIYYMRCYQFSTLCAGAKLGKPEENAKIRAPADSGSAKEAVVHEESVCTVTGSAGFRRWGALGSRRGGRPHVRIQNV